MDLTNAALAVLAAAIAAGVVIFFLRRREPQRPRLDAPFRGKPLLGKAELALLERLSEALPDNLVLAQVSVARFVTIQAQGTAWSEARRRLGDMAVDFLVCAPDATPLVAIEIEDKLHQQESHQLARAEKAAVMKSACVRLVCWNAGDLPSGAAIRKAVFPDPPPAAAPAAPVAQVVALVPRR